MSKSYTLVILESPGKVNKVQQILGKGYKAIASVGHIIDLDPKSISVKIDKDFEPIYKPVPRQRKTIQALKAAAKKASKIIFMCDNDREGEQIAWSVAYVTGTKNPQKIIFNSITKTAILEGMKNPVPLDQNLINAQKARRILDRLVGYELSPLLWKNIQPKLSAGRVQSVVVKIIIDRENEINDFLKTGDSSYFKFNGTFLTNKIKQIITNLHDLVSINKDGIYKGGLAKIKTEEESRKFLKNAIKSIYTVENVYDKKRESNPSAPYTTSTLQQDASRKLGFAVKRTMMAAQHLYESGNITYMRTDSTNLSKEALNNIKKYVISTYGNKYYRKKIYAKKVKHIQEAHEAVRPTHINIIDVKNGGKIGSDEKNLYKLIWRRIVASQMMPAVYKVTTIQIFISHVKKYYFGTSIDNLIFPGYLAVYNIANNGSNNNKNVKIPDPGTKLNVGSITGTQTYLQPPGRYTEASLINKMDPKNLNIGRPATYASIIAKIQDRRYVRRDDILGKEKTALILSWGGKSTYKITEDSKTIMVGKENKKFVPTMIGRLVTDYLTTGFPKIMDYAFTADMEEKLDDIAKGKRNWVKTLQIFYKDFHSQVEKLKKQGSLIKEKYTKILGQDPKTGVDVVATIGKYGPMVKLCLTKTKCKIGPIKEPLTLDNITLKDALKILEYPKELGTYKKKKILLKIGKYGNYLTHGNKNYRLDTGDITFSEAKKIIDEIDKERKKKHLVEFQSKTKLYVVLEGKFGKYIRVTPLKGKTKGYNIPLLKDVKIEDLTLEKVLEIEKNYFEYKKTKWKKKKKAKSTTKTDNKSKTDNKKTGGTTKKRTHNKKKLISKKTIRKAKRNKINIIE
uniref:DNA topoisomerase n=1 Tax=Mimivirus LCMiAC01 TaxID=2506608 RepID=A0A481Z0P0_9VIRU|nr:MAG: DNA topoisomerase I [Mimivirus LCMiAC01]